MTPGIQELMREVERVRDGFRRAVLAGDRGGGGGTVRGRGDAGRPAGGHRSRGPRGGARPPRAGRRAPAGRPGVRPALPHRRPVPGGRRGAGLLPPRPRAAVVAARRHRDRAAGGGRWRSRWRRSGRGGCWRCGHCGTTRRCSPGSACPRTRCTRRRSRCPGARGHAAGGEREAVGIVGGACDDPWREWSAGVAGAAGPGAGRRAAGRPGHAGGLWRLPRVALCAGQRGHGAVCAVRRGGTRDALADPRQPGRAGAHPARGAAGRLAAGHASARCCR